jgi:galactokinase
MTGGGFGGCTVALVAEDAVADLRDAVCRLYPLRTGRTPTVYVCRGAAGAGTVSEG